MRGANSLPSPRWGRRRHAEHADGGGVRTAVQAKPREASPSITACATPSVIALTRADSFPIEGKQEDLP